MTSQKRRDVPQQRYWVFYLGLTEDVVETYWWEIVDTYHWDALVKYHWDVVGCFIWDLFETSWRRADGTSFLRPFETSLRRSNKTLGDVALRRLGDVLSRRRWVFYLGRTCDVAGTYREMSVRRRHDVLMPVGKTFIEYSNDMQDIYTNIDECNANIERKMLIVFDDMVVNKINNNKLHSKVTELFIRDRKLNNSLVFITQLYFKVPEDVRQSSTHLFIIKIPNKRELQQITLNHSADIKSS